MSKVGSFRPSNPNDVQTVDQALAAIITVCRDNINLPVVDPLYVYLYKNSASFAFYGHGWTTLPYDVAGRDAFAKDNTMHIDLEKTPSGSASTLLRILAHEYGHNIQYEIAGKEPPTRRWITEGFADWIAAKVFDVLDWQRYDVTVHRRKQEVLRQRDFVPDMLSLLHSGNWDLALSKPKGFVMTHSLALVAVDRLIADKGLPAVIEHLNYGNFERSFGFSREDFAADLGRYLTATRLPKSSRFRVDKPVWMIGDQWSYLESRPGVRAKLVRKVNGEDMFQGVPSFVLEQGGEDHYYAKETFGLIATAQDGKRTSGTDRLNRLLSWPLENDKEWRNTFVRKDLKDKSSRNFDRLMIVTGVEEVKVPAGVFETIKIEAYGYTSGYLMAEYWYSPKVKWFVRTRMYRNEEGLTEEELLSFDVKP